MIKIDPSVFSRDAVSDETRDFNRDLVETLSNLVDQWSVPPEAVRQARKEGNGPFPLPPLASYGTETEISGKHGPVKLRILFPEHLHEQGAKGVYLNIHGGGWTFGSHDSQDGFLDFLCRENDFACVSVDYRLAPEHPYPEGPDDCEAAALWLIEEAERRFGSDKLFVGGDSAGAHLAAVTLLRLRDRHGIQPFSGVNFIAGCFDLALTPSARNWGAEKLVLNTRDIRNFVAAFLSKGGDVRSADISPIRGNLEGLPPALFTVGSKDALLDDSMFMASRWQAAGNEAHLSIYPGGCHVFQMFDLEITRRSRLEMSRFLARLAEDRS